MTKSSDGTLSDQLSAPWTTAVLQPPSICLLLTTIYGYVTSQRSKDFDFDCVYGLADPPQGTTRRTFSLPRQFRCVNFDCYSTLYIEYCRAISEMRQLLPDAGDGVQPKGRHMTEHGSAATKDLWRSVLDAGWTVRDLIPYAAGRADLNPAGILTSRNIGMDQMMLTGPLLDTKTILSFVCL